MEAADLLALTQRMLDQLELGYALSDDGETLVVATEDDGTLFVGTTTIEDSNEREWPVLWLDLPLMVDVEAPNGLDPFRLAALNQDLVVGKVAVDEGVLSLQHEFVGWPGAAEYKVAVEALVGHASMILDELDEVVSSRPTPYSELVGE